MRVLYYRHFGDAQTQLDIGLAIRQRLAGSIAEPMVYISVSEQDIERLKTSPNHAMAHKTIEDCVSGNFKPNTDTSLVLALDVANADISVIDRRYELWWGLNRIQQQNQS